MKQRLGLNLKCQYGKARTTFWKLTICTSLNSLPRKCASWGPRVLEPNDPPCLRAASARLHENCLAFVGPVWEPSFSPPPPQKVHVGHFCIASLPLKNDAHKLVFGAGKNSGSDSWHLQDGSCCATTGQALKNPWGPHRTPQSPTEHIQETPQRAFRTFQKQLSESFQEGCAP